MSTNTTKNEVTKEIDITSKVLTRINQFQTNGEIVLPKDYSPENALKNAYLQLSEMKDKNGVSILESCTKTSISTALLQMVTWGLSPIKQQVYFIPYGNKLQISKSYLGNIAIAKRVAGVDRVNAQVIYKDDDFAYSVDAETGDIKIDYHKPSLSSIDEGTIIGAYAVVIFNDGTKKVDLMTMKQIKKSWEQGATKGGSPAHRNFEAEMSKKTIINRALKTIIGSSTDAGLYEEKEPETAKEQVAEKIQEKANVEIIDFEDVTIEEQENEIIAEEVVEVKPENKKTEGVKPNELFDSEEEAGF